MPLNMDQIFELFAQNQNASDLILTPGFPAALWVSRRMQPVGEPLTPSDISQAFLPGLSADSQKRLDEIGDLDYSISQSGIGRLRVNIHRQRGTYSVAIRFIRYHVPSFEDLRLPAKIQEFAQLPRGLVLITGGTGTGKSTTLGAMIDYMNQNFAYHIITLEDPIEYTFKHNKSVIEQREIDVDSPSFASALRHVVRQRPDVILIGEMRDLETIGIALTAAETGHLVLASLHTNSAVQSIDRIIDVFPANQQTQIRVQLSASLQAVTCQTLFHDQLTGGMAPAIEILVPTPAVRRAIRDSETHLLQSMIETGKALGMQTMDDAIARLVWAGHVTAEEAMARAQDPEKLRRLLAA